MTVGRYLWRGMVLASGALGLAGVLVVAAGARLAAPVQGAVGPPPAGLPVEAVTFRGSGGSRLRGWLLEGAAGRGGVVLMHGIRADRRSMVARARFLAAAGYSVLLFDFQAHGESEGRAITFGHLEAADARAAVAFARARLPGEPLGVIGVSLGGAAFLLGSGRLEVDAAVLEAVYPDIRQAASNRLRLWLGPMGAWLAPLLVGQLEHRLGVDAADLRPVERIGSLDAPVLIIAGTADRRTTPAESEALLRAAPEPKALWLVPGAAHVDLHRYAGAAYETAVADFLHRHLREQGSANKDR